jgi:hypothetical protein
MNLYKINPCSSNKCKKRLLPYFGLNNTCVEVRSKTRKGNVYPTCIGKQVCPSSVQSCATWDVYVFSRALLASRVPIITHKHISEVCIEAERQKKYIGLKNIVYIERFTHNHRIHTSIYEVAACSHALS